MDQTNNPVPVEAPLTPTGDPGYKYEDIHKVSTRDIVEDKPVVEEKKEEIVEPPKVAEPPKVEEVKEPEIPLEEVGQKIAIEAAKQVLEEQKAAIEAAKPPQDEYEQFTKEVWDKEKRAPTYKEALEFVSQKAEQALEERQKAKEQAVLEQQKQAAASREQQEKVVSDYIDDELSDLYASGKLTKIQDPQSPSDQGVAERKALFQKMMEVNQERISQNKRPIYSIKTIFYEHYQKPTVQPPGADAPISTRRGTATPPGAEPDTYSYKEIHSKPWSLFKQRP